MHGQKLASSPGLFFSLNVTKEMNRWTDKRVSKIGLVFIAGVAVHMCQPLPRFLVIVYVCKLRGFSGIFSVYSCILSRVSANYSELSCTVVIELLYGLLRIDREVFTQAKARSSDAPLQWCNAVC